MARANPILATHLKRAASPKPRPASVTTTAYLFKSAEASRRDEWPRECVHFVSGDRANEPEQNKSLRLSETEKRNLIRKVGKVIKGGNAAAGAAHRRRTTAAHQFSFINHAQPRPHTDARAGPAHTAAHTHRHRGPSARPAPPSINPARTLTGRVLELVNES